jgi:hypothetical protein
MLFIIMVRLTMETLPAAERVAGEVWNWRQSVKVNSMIRATMLENNITS